MFIIITFLIVNIFFKNISCIDNQFEEITKNNFSIIQESLDSLTEENAPDVLKDLLRQRNDDKYV